jgi:hypothetical protein
MLAAECTVIREPAHATANAAAALASGVHDALTLSMRWLRNSV